MGIAWLLPRIIGFGRATELLLTGEFVEPKEALRLGLYNRVVPDHLVLESAVDFSLRVAAGPSAAHGVTKDALESEAFMTLDDALEAEAKAQAECMEHPDFHEGYQAFVERRSPNFS